MTTPTIPLSEFSRRRQQLLKTLGKSAGLVLAGDPSQPTVGTVPADRNFYYLTGLDETGGAVLFDPSHEDPARRICLFLRPVNPEVDRWDGYRPLIGQALRQSSGFASVFRMSALPAMLTAAARRTRSLACLHPLAIYPAPVSPDLAILRQVAERVPGVTITDRSNDFARQRAVKSRAELAMVRQAIAVTLTGYSRLPAALVPGATEATLARALHRGYEDAGGQGVAYNSIVGSGLNGTVLHYNRNDAPLVPGDLIVIDSAAQVGGYTSDVTRTYPVSGRFTPAQRKLYECVLKAQLAAIAAARPGARWHELDAAARDVITHAGYGDYFIHGIGHPLGLEVHDVNPLGPLEAGMVITVEPGIYLPDIKTGIRIEDDVLITSRGAKVLTSAFPKTVADVEAWLRKRRS